MPHLRIFFDIFLPEHPHRPETAIAACLRVRKAGQKGLAIRTCGEYRVVGVYVGEPLPEEPVSEPTEAPDTAGLKADDLPVPCDRVPGGDPTPGPDASAPELPVVTQADPSDIAWVAEALGVAAHSKGRIHPAHAPSGTAWALYAVARSTTTTKKWFFQSIWPKILPKEIQSQPSTRDHVGASTQEHIGKLQQISRKARGEDG